MRGSKDRINTSHVGSLPRPDDLIKANQARELGENSNEQAFQALLQSSVTDIVKRQREAGISIPNDGEFGKSMGQAVNYRAWLSYIFIRLDGLEVPAKGTPEPPPRTPRADEFIPVDLMERRDRAKFMRAYTNPEQPISTGPQRPPRPVCTGPVKYNGHAAIKADIAHFKAAMAANGVEEGFMSSIGPGSASRVGNAYYKTDEEFMFACADALHEEYKAIVDAGIVLQIDDPSIADNWDAIVPEPSVDQYKKFTMVRVEALNQALKGIPQDRVRFHLCWGSWHGPHVTDIPLRGIVDVALQIKCQAYSFEAANVRHEHEWSVWRDVKLPDDKLILPGIVSHATNVVEHPDLVAERIGRFAEVVGKERVIASTDCGLGGRIPPDIAWAKLEALAQGAEIASKRLWGQR
jgi:5-methyltetrahydropteroyltriglutamate--homocysteine methyltransferase